MAEQFCAICAWRENCSKKFCVADGGAHCPDFTRDISLRNETGPGGGDRQDSGAGSGGK